MQLLCTSCSRTLEISGEAPSFCAYCGQPFAKQKTPSTVNLEAETLPPPEIHESTSPIPEKQPDHVGGYRLLRVLGQGGMGTVYEAEEETSGRHVALKLISAEFAQSKEAVLRFRQEGRLASAVVHPRCVFVLATDEDGGRPYIVMELMPGTTLKDVIDQHGPMKTAEAVTRILDVIEGLQESHRLGVVHRDVKPSNCFMDKEGRVKIGDFGLAKSLVRDSHLTKTGSFLGTPLYSSPEQVKGEAIDEQSDVYSVAATLYYLLTGQAPHQGTDTMATLARIISDPAPPMRSVRPELSADLDQIVLHGLERNRKDRWQSLEELRSALLPFVPGHMSKTGMGVRFGAYAIDCVLLWLFVMCIITVLTVLMVTGSLSERTLALLRGVLPAPIGILYFGLMEWMWGCTLGKRWLRLRVRAADDSGKPTLGQAFLRSSIFELISGWGQLASAFIIFESAFVDRDDRLRVPPEMILLGGFLNVAAIVLGVIATVCTMRTWNGYRGLHEFISGTRTVRLPRRVSQRTLGSGAFQLEISHPEGLPSEIGPYIIQGALRWTDHERTLLGEDPRINRSVWIWLRSAKELPLDAARREINRSSRIRWVACGETGDWQWDAFLAPSGSPLPAMVAHEGPLSWTDARPIIEQLSAELATSLAEGTLPQTLLPHQVWLTATGRVQLLGTPLAGSETLVVSPADQDPRRAAQREEARAFQLLREVAVLLLEGKPRTTVRESRAINAPVPLHARHILDRLMGSIQPYRKLTTLQKDLSDSRELQTEVTRPLRLATLTIQAVTWLGVTFLILMTAGILIAFMFSLQGTDLQGHPKVSGHDVETAFITAIIVWYPIWVIWSFAFRGGLAFRLAGVALVNRAGHLASRWRCLWRSFLIWTPIYLSIVATFYVTALTDGHVPPELSWLPWLILLLAGGYFVLALLFPRRNVQDSLSGTVLVPR